MVGLRLGAGVAAAVVLAGSMAAWGQEKGSVKEHVLGEQIKRLPKHFADGSDLPNGWRITPAGKAVGEMNDLVMNMVASPDGKVLISLNCGFLPAALDVFDAVTYKKVQHIELTAGWLGMAWSADGKTLYVSGGNASGNKSKRDPVSAVYEFSYAKGRLSEQPTGRLVETVSPEDVWWSGVAYLPSKHLVYAANRGTGTGPSDVVVFDAKTRKVVTRIGVETTPYDVLLTKDGKTLFVSNWSSESVSVIDTATNEVVRRLKVGSNPNAMAQSADGRVFVACSNDNTVWVIDAKKMEVMERLSTTQTPLAPEGSTPDALAVDDARKLLYIANADNNSIAVAHIENRMHSTVVGFIPSGWYPSALLLTEHNTKLFIGNGKGEEGHPDPNGPHFGKDSDKTLQVSSLEVLPVADLKMRLPAWTKQVAANTPYHDSLLSEAREPVGASVIPQEVGKGSPIEHVIYIIKENRTYDQEFGDIAKANGDPKLTLFGEKVTPNQHALANEYVVLDNLYCDGEVSVDGHSWSNSAYATDFNEKQWPAMYGGHSQASYSVRAMVPSAGHLWDLARTKGLTYRSYGENAARASNGGAMEAAPGGEGLVGHVSPDYGRGLVLRDMERVAIFLKEFKQYEANFDSPDAEKRLPNYIVMSMPEDHTQATRPGAFTPQAMVADNDHAIGELVDAVSHSKYWAKTAIFIIEDDAQDGADHVDGRRTVGLVISPYVKRGIVDSTLYSTSSMIRSMELLLGLPPMSQYDSSAMPLYNSFGTEAVVTPFNVIAPKIDVNAKNSKKSYGADESSKMDLRDVDRAPMQAMNVILWKSIKGADSVMPPPVHRFRPLVDVSESGKKKKDDDD
ncbi:MAG: bifunctional YncE family protein/alkaline phosphatase family protein [Acidobacteriota bacterium]